MTQAGESEVDDRHIQPPPDLRDVRHSGTRRRTSLNNGTSIEDDGLANFLIDRLSEFRIFWDADLDLFHTVIARKIEFVFTQLTRQSAKKCLCRFGKFFGCFCCRPHPSGAASDVKIESRDTH